MCRPEARRHGKESVMDVVEFREFCLSLGDVSEKMPFGKFAARYDSILVFYVSGHMFCLVDIDDFGFVDVKSTPEEIERMKLAYASVGRPINLSERHWIRLDFDGDIPDRAVYACVRRAFELVKARYAPQAKR